MTRASVAQRTPHPQTTRPALYSAAAVTLIVVLYGAVRHDRLGYAVVGAVGIFAIGLAAMMAPRFVICVGVASPLLPLPSRAPFAFSVGGGSLYLADLLVLVAALLCLRKDLRPRSKVCLGTAGLFLLVGFIGAILGNPSLGLLGRDARGPLQLALGAVIGLSAIRDAHLMVYLIRTLSVILWSGAVAVSLSLTTGINLTFGRVDETTSTLINNVRTTYGASRFALQVSNVAALVLGAVIVLLLVRQTRARAVLLPFLVPSLFLTFESFSRNNLLALTLACAVAGVTSVRRGVVVPAVARALIGMVAILATAFVAYYALALAGAAVGRSNPLTAQLSTYKGRVLDELTGSNLQGDASWQFRQLEWRYAEKSLEAAPVFGHGFGASYRPLLPSDPFGGTIYAHNWYAWVLAKTGVVGALLLAVIFLGPLATLVIGARRGEQAAPLCTAVLVSSVSALGVMTVAPLVEASGTALYVGVVAGLAWGLHGKLRRGLPAVAGRDHRRTTRAVKVHRVRSSGAHSAFRSI